MKPTYYPEKLEEARDFFKMQMLTNERLIKKNSDKPIMQELSKAYAEEIPLLKIAIWAIEKQIGVQADD